MSQLPPGWTLAPIEVLGELRLGKMLDKAKNQGLPAKYLRNINVRWFQFDLEDMHTIFVSSAEREQLSVEDGDLFVCEGGEPGRCAVWRGGDNVLVYQKALHRFRSQGGMIPELLMYRLRHDAETGALGEAFTGTTIKHLTRQSLASYEVPVPPLQEQKRIADRLNSLLKRVAACRERLDRVPDILKRFRQSVLAAATSGELTREWRLSRTGSELRSDWQFERLADLCHRDRVITYGVIKLGDEVVGGVPCLRTSNVRWLHIDTTGIKRIAPTLAARYGRTMLTGGEVLVNVRGTLGGVAVATPQMRGWNVSREVAVVPVDAGRVDPKYLSYWVGSDSSQRWLAGVEKGVAYTGINIEDLRHLPVAVPPMEEQREVSARVDSLLASADMVDGAYRAALMQTEMLTPAVLTRAFRGELVPQDPGDEPASELLARLKARQSIAAAKRPRKRTKTQARRGRRSTMHAIDKNAVKAAILRLSTDRFSFDEVRAQVPGDYDSLKDAIFELLEEPSPIVRQVFDKKAKAMQLVRVRQ